MAIKLAVVGSYDNTAIAKAQRELDNLAKTAETTATRIATKMGQVGGTLTNLGGNLTRKVTLPLTLAGGAAIKFAGEAEDSAALAESVFGSSNAIVDEFGKNAASTYGLTIQQTDEFASQFGIRIKNIGDVTEAEAARQSTFLLGLTADLSSAFGRSNEDSAAALTAALAGETESLKGFGIVINETNLKAEALSSGIVTATVDTLALSRGQEAAEKAQRAYSTAVADYGPDSVQATDAMRDLDQATASLDKVMEGSVPALTAAQKQQATLALITQQTSDIQGDFTRNADGATNATKIAAAEAKNAAADLGTTLLPAFVKGTQLAASFARWLGGLSDGQKKAAVFAGVFAAALGPVLTVVGNVVKLGGSLVKVYGKIGPVLTKLGPALRTLTTGFLNIARAIASNIAAAAKWAVQMVIQAVKATAAAVASIATQVAQWVVLAAASLAGAAQVAIAWLISMGPIALVIAAVVGLVIIIVKNWDTIKEVITRVATAVADFLAAVWTKIVDAAKAAFNFLVDAAKKGMDLFLLPIRIQIAAARAVFEALFVWLPNKVKEGIDLAKEKASAALEFLTGAFSSAGETIKTAISEVFTNIVEKVSGLGSRIATAATGIFNGVRDAFKSAINWIIDKWNALSFSTPKFSVLGQDVPSVTVGTKDIPRLAAGGVAYSPTLAYIGDYSGVRRNPEYALREDQLSALLTQAANQSKTTPSGPSVVIQKLVVPRGQTMESWLESASHRYGVNL